MKPAALILSFLPLIAFSLLARFLPHDLIGVAALIAAVCAAAAMVTSRPVWPPKILNACSLILFAVIAVAGFTLNHHGDRWLATWGGAGVGLVLGLVILVLVPVAPFTGQFARESTPEAYWSSPTFRKVNRVLSASWGAAIFGLGVSRTVAAAISEHTGARWPEVIFGLLIPVLVLVQMVKFSKSYPERVTHEPAHAPAGRP